MADPAIELIGADALQWDERGLIPTIVQDATTGAVLTLAYMSRESLRLSLEQGEVWFWSRKRRALWHKGATSGRTAIYEYAIGRPTPDDKSNSSATLAVCELAAGYC